MKFILFTFVLINVLSSSQAKRTSEEDLKEWKQFKNKYAKIYDKADEEVFRKEVFIRNLRFIHQHNKKYANEEESYSVAVNQYADMTNDEFKRTMNGYKSGMKKRFNTGAKKLETLDLPKSVDWRSEGAVTDVKNQGSCASCWAFSTTGSLEGQLFRKRRTLLSLSEQNLLDCSVTYGNDGCSGGVMDFAFNYVINNKGLATEDSYAYNARAGHCSWVSTHTHNLAAASHFVDIARESEPELMEAVASAGPVSIAIDASGSGLQFYSYGVYKSSYCSRTELDHAMLVVGYGTKSGSWFWDGDYWIVKNSWGVSWGMDGYVWIGRNLSNMCGIATEASYPVL